MKWQVIQSSLYNILELTIIFQLFYEPAFWIFAAAVEFAVNTSSQHNVSFIALWAFPFDIAFCNCLCLNAGFSFNILARALWVKAEFHWLLRLFDGKNFLKAANLAVFLCRLYECVFRQ